MDILQRDKLGRRECTRPYQASEARVSGEAPAASLLEGVLNPNNTPAEPAAMTSGTDSLLLGERSESPSGEARRALPGEGVLNPNNCVLNPNNCRNKC